MEWWSFWIQVILVGMGLMVWGPGILLGAGPEQKRRGRPARGQAAVGTQNSFDGGGFRIGC